MKPALSLLAFFFLLSTLAFSQKTLILQPGPDMGMDTYVNSAFPDDTDGESEGLSANAWTYSGVPGTGRALVRFDLSSLPAGTVVLDARLTFYFDPAIAFGQQYGYNEGFIERITSSWDQLTTTWNTQPAVTSLGQVSVPRTNTLTQDLSDIDMTEMVQGWVNNPASNFGLMHRMQTEVEYCCVVYGSSNNHVPLKRPKLVVTYRDCSPPVAGFSFFTQIPLVQFTDTSSSATSWFWDFGDGYFSNLQNPQHAYAALGLYPVCLRIIDSCGQDTICKEVHVCEMPEPHFYFTVNAQSVSFHDSSSSPQSWFWDFNDGFYSNLENPEHHFNKPGVYLVCEEVTNSCGTQSFCDSVKAAPDGIEKVDETGAISVYPNPASQRLYISLNFKPGTSTTAELLSLTGKMLDAWKIEQKNSKTIETIDVSGLPPSVYLLRIKNDQSAFTGKVIIQ